MSLYDHYSEGKWLTEGWQDVRVDAVKSVTANTGTDGIEFNAVNDESGSERGVTFWLTEKAMWRLAGFAKACGLSDDEMKAYNEGSMTSHRSLINRRVSVFVEKVPSQTDPTKSYNEIVDWQPVGSDKPAVVPQQTPPAPEDDSIPF